MPEPAPVGRRFPRAARMQRAREFSHVRQHGRRATRGCLVLNWMALPAGSSSKLGLITTKKLGGAVVRSRARRLLREVYRLRQTEFVQPVAMVLVARHSIVGRKMADVDRDFVFLARQANILKSNG